MKKLLALGALGAGVALGVKLAREAGLDQKAAALALEAKARGAVLAEKAIAKAVTLADRGLTWVDNVTQTEEQGSKTQDAPPAPSNGNGAHVGWPAGADLR